jgi:hypothetical protein
MKIRQWFAAAVMVAAMSSALAGEHADGLSRCLVEKTTHEDKIALVQWMFVAMAQHPSVASLTTVKPEDVEKHNKSAAELFVRLLTETCGEASRKAVQIEGANSLEHSFELLGGAAIESLMTDPAVTRMMDGLDKYLDTDKLAELAKPVKK